MENFRTHIHCCLKYKVVCHLWKLVGKFLKKLKIEQSYVPAILPLGIYLKKMKSGSLKDFHLYCSIIHLAER